MSPDCNGLRLLGSQMQVQGDGSLSIPIHYLPSTINEAGIELPIVNFESSCWRLLDR